MKISILLEALTGTFETDMNRASKSGQKRMKELEKAAKQAGQVIGAALAAGAAASIVALRSAINHADELNEISKKIGIPTDVLSSLDYAAKLSGVATEELQGGLQKMIKFQAAAAAGGKEQTKVFQTLGIAIKDSSGNLRDANSLFADFADVFSRLKDSPEKAALAMKVFGKTGTELIPLLNEGRGGIAGMADEFRKLGGEIDPVSAKLADEFNDNLDKAKAAVAGLAWQVAKDLLPDLVALSGQFVESAKQGDGVATTAHSIAEGIRYMAGVIDGAVKFVQALTSYLIGLYGIMERISSLNPAYIFARWAETGKLFKFGVESPGAAFTMGNEALTSITPETTGLPRGGSSSASAVSATSLIRASIASAKQPDLSPLFSPTLKAAKETKQKTDADKEAKQAAEDYAKAVEGLNDVLRDQAEASGGPALAAAYDYKDALIEIAGVETELQRLGKLDADTQGQLATAREAAADAYAKAIEKIEATKTPLEELLEDMQFELDLLGKSNAERTVANELRRVGVGLSAEELKAAEESIKAKALEIEAAQKQISALDEFRSAFEDNVVDVLNGSKSIVDAFKSMADFVIQQILRMLAQKWTEQLFGAMGTSQTGSSGGWLQSIFSLFGAGGGSSSSNFGIPMPGSGAIDGFATGTDYAPGGLAWVGERGRELVRLPRGSQVIPNHRLEGMGGGGFVQNVANYFAAPTEVRTQQQVAQRLAFQGRRAQVRNGVAA